MLTPQKPASLRMRANGYQRVSPLLGRHTSLRSNREKLAVGLSKNGTAPLKMHTLQTNASFYFQILYLPLWPQFP